jgi:hypothetical protein
MDKMVVRGEVQDLSVRLRSREVPAVEPLAPLSRGIMAAHIAVRDLVVAVVLVPQELQIMEVMDYNPQLREHPATMEVVVLELTVTDPLLEPVVRVEVAACVVIFQAQMVLEEELVQTIMAAFRLLQSKAVMELLFYSFLVIIKDVFVGLIHYFK